MDFFHSPSRLMQSTLEGLRCVAPVSATVPFQSGADIRPQVPDRPELAGGVTYAVLIAMSAVDPIPAGRAPQKLTFADFAKRPAAVTQERRT